MTWTFTASPDVAHALDAGVPVVALESTIITHGMPYPANLETAQTVEQTVLDQGAVPATIAVIGGTIRVGLGANDLHDLAKTTDAMKLSRADLAFALAMGRTGSTTVAGTMMLAALAGIHTFATGGIGGVHRGADQTMDVSADLAEFAQTPVTVVCAGAKAILDIPKTLEVLETLGVPVIAMGQDAFPAFWSQSSGLEAPLRCDTAVDIAKIAALRASQPQPGGVLVANPIPAQAEIPKSQIDPVIDAALIAAQEQNITGKAVTPFLLSRMLDATAGASLDANVALIVSNARLAAEIAVARQEEWS
ncbi:MAG: pseudouridine-5'-phosphate glycosidase [Pseudomonadota bacterium]